MEKILIVRPPSLTFNRKRYVRDFDVPFMLKYLESVILSQNKYKVKFIDCIVDSLEWGILEEITKKFLPDILILHTLVHDRNCVFEYVNKMKKGNKNIIIIAIGPDATACPERYIFESSPFDFSIAGECESSLLELLGSLRQRQHKKINGVYSISHKDNSIIENENLDSLPFPVYSKSDLQKYHLSYPVRIYKKVIWGHILSSRGCQHKCMFCSQIVRQTYGKKIRLRGAESVIQEIRYLLNLGANMISFCDDNFTCSYGHVTSICKAIINNKLSVKWSAQARVDELDDKLLKLMEEAGCIHIRFGLESGSEKILKILRKTNNANLWLTQAKKVFDECRKLGIDTVALFILGTPLETEEDIKKTAQFAIDLNPDFLQLHYFIPYPGSVFYLENKIEMDKIVYKENFFHYSPPEMVFNNMKEEILSREMKRIYKDFYLRPRYIINNLYKFGLFYLSNPNIIMPLLKQLKRNI